MSPVRIERPRRPVIQRGMGTTATIQVGKVGPRGPEGDKGAPGGSDESTATWIETEGTQTRAALTNAIDERIGAPVLLLEPNGVVPAETTPGTLVFRKQATYTSVVLSDGPVGYWRLDEAAAGATADSSGYDRHGAGPVGGYTVGMPALAAGAGGTAVSLNGSTGYIPLPTSSVFEATDAGAFTFEAWVKIDNPSADALQLIATKTDISTGTHKQWYIAYDNRAAQGSPGRLRFALGAGIITIDWVGGQSSLATGGHLVCRKDGSNLSIWWNGTRVSSSTAPAAFQLATNGKALSLGGFSGGTFWLDGTLDEVAVYQAALPDARIQEHYNMGAA